MSRISEPQDGKYYLRGLLIRQLSNDKIPIKLLRCTDTCTPLLKEDNDISCYKANFKSKLEPPAYLANRFQNSENNNYYDHHVYCLDVPMLDNVTFFVAAPNQEVLEIVRPLSVYCEYVKCDLLKICSDQFVGSQNKNIKVTRLNARLVGDLGDAISSVAFYGNDVIPSQVIKAVLGIGKNSVRSTIHDPFVTENERRQRSELLNQDRFINPKSIRLMWNNGKGKPVSLNIDIFGNFSLYCYDESTFKGVTKIFQYLHSINAFIQNITLDPLKRSAKALEIITT